MSRWTIINWMPGLLGQNRRLINLLMVKRKFPPFQPYEFPVIRTTYSCRYVLRSEKVKLRPAFLELPLPPFPDACRPAPRRHPTPRAEPRSCRAVKFFTNGDLRTPCSF